MSIDVQNEELGPVCGTVCGQFSHESQINENEEFKYQDERTVENNEGNKEQSVRVRDISVMLANGYEEADEDANLNAGLKLPAIGNSVSLNNATIVNNHKSLVNSDIFSFNGDEADDIVPTDVKLEIDDKCSLDDDNFELRILDDENEIPEMKFNSKLDPSLVRDEYSREEYDILRSESVQNLISSSTDLENAAISDTSNNNNDDGKFRRLTTAAATVEMSSTIDNRTISNRAGVYNCVWCMKQFPSKTSLKFHVLSHLRAIKQDNKNSYLASISEVDNTIVDDANADVFLNFVCVFCDESFTSKKAVIIHYVTVHHQSDSQSQNRSKRTALNGRYWQSCENKIPDTTTAPIIPGSTEESSTMLNNDENSLNEDASKQYKCYICDKQFARNSSLLWHIQRHETSKLPKLDKNISESDLPSPAMVIMDGGVDDDISNTRTSNDYAQHMKSAHKISNEEELSLQQQISGHKCESCGKFFSTSSNMRKHARKHCKGPSSMPESEDDDDDEGISEDPLKEFLCDICDRSFCSQRAVSIHRATKHRDELSDSVADDSRLDDPLSCDTFSENGMPKHIRRHRTGPSSISEGDDDYEDASEDPLKEFLCNVCDRSFCSQRAVNIHHSCKHRDELSDSAANDTRIDELIPCDAYTENEDGNFQCSVCDKIFETRKGVIRHIGYHRSAVNESMNDSGNTDEEEESIPCPTCGKTFASLRGMRIHFNKHVEETEFHENSDGDDDDERNESGFECKICSKTFEGFRSYKIHVGWHTRREETVVITPKEKPDRSETVIIPPKKPEKSEVVAHSQKKSDKFEAAAVPQKKSDKSISSTSASSQIHQCQYCPRQYSTQQALAGHMKVHQSLKTATSQGSGQPQLQILNQKTQSHTTVAMPAKSSSQPLTLEDTMECDICHKSFMHKQDIGKHMRDHMNGTLTRDNVDLSMFCCIYCQKSFVGRKSLSTHQRLHEEAQVAPKRAANQLLTDASPAKQRRLSDLAESAGDNSLGYLCEICDRRLSTKQSLQRHMESHARMREAHGPSAHSPKEAMITAAAPAPQQKEQSRIQDEVQDENSQTVVVNDLEALGEHAVVQCIKGGNEEYFVFEQREGEAFQCSECDETHFDKLQMIVHMAYHVGERWANGCQKSLIIKIDPIMLAPFECLFCDERFVKRVFRREHMAKRHSDRVMQCNSCQKLFFKKKKLAAHCQQHFSDPVYRCEDCLECFTSQRSLKRHACNKRTGESSPEIKQEQSYPTSDVESSNDE